MAAIVPDHPQNSALVTFTNFNPIKLTKDNYSLWLPQIVPHLQGGNLFGYVDGTIPQPEPNIEVTNADGVTTTSLNPAYLHWNMQDQLILGTITSALSENMISHVCTMQNIQIYLDNLGDSLHISFPCLYHAGALPTGHTQKG